MLMWQIAHEKGNCFKNINLAKSKIFSVFNINFLGGAIAKVYLHCWN